MKHISEEAREEVDDRQRTEFKILGGRSFLLLSATSCCMSQKG